MFGTSGVRGPVGDTVTADLALDVGRALVSEGYETVVVGRDVRDSGEMLLDALVAGICECGGEAIDVGIEATPTIARSVGWLDADSGVAITASHNPPADNGLKLWSPTGQAFDSEAQRAVADRIDAGAFARSSWDGVGTRRHTETMRDRHAAALSDAVSVGSAHRVAVDVGNGAGGVTASVLGRLGCSVSTLNGQEDGSFPGRPSEPTAETLSDLSTFVRYSDVSIGIAHDGDADRMMAVDDGGDFVPKDVLLALFARSVVDSGDTIAAPVDTSMAVDDAVEDLGGSVTRTRVGDVYVAERAREAGVVFGGEPSGAWIWPSATLCPDGPLAACKLVELVDTLGPLSECVDAIPTYPIRRTSIETDDRERAMEAIAGTVADDYEDFSTLDGVRVSFEGGWFLLRASGTQPLIRVTAEARSADRTDEIYDAAVTIVEDALR